MNEDVVARSYSAQKPTMVLAGKPTIAVDPAILWKPIASPTRLNYTGTSIEAVTIALRMAFGEFPIRLTRDHLKVLEGMIAASTGSQPYKELYQALTNIGELELTRQE